MTNIISIGQIYAIRNNIVAKKTTELVLLLHKKTTKLVFLWLNMGQKSFKVLKPKVVIILKFQCNSTKSIDVFKQLRKKET